MNVGQAGAAPQVHVEAEEEVYSYVPADNGAGPLWCYGSTCIVAEGAQVHVAGLETIIDRQPPNNVRWRLHRRTAQGWEVAYTDREHYTREPAPLGYSHGRLWLSANPALAPSMGKWGIPAQPQLLEFRAADPAAGYTTLRPDWGGEPLFTEHSYRGMAVDGVRGEALLLSINGHVAQHWAFLDRTGSWAANGQLVFPWSAEDGEALRLCYPNVALSAGQAVVMGVSDIVEPHREWREAKFEVTQREWDYVFRRLYYAWTPDIAATPFAEWVEIANQEEYAGHIRNEDALITSQGIVHLLWTEQSVDARIRSRFFPTARNRVTLEHAVLESGQVVRRETFLEWNEGEQGACPLWARFHASPDGRVFVFAAVADGGPTGGRASNWVFEVLPAGGRSGAATLDVAKPLTRFMLATPRSGSSPSETLHAIGQSGDESVIRYVQARLA